MNKTERFVIDMTDGFKGHSQTSLYTDAQGIERANYSGYLYNSKGQDLTAAEYLALPDHEGRQLQIVTWPELEDLIDAHHKSQITPAREITREDFWEALEVLPPENWTQDGHMEHFRMCEYWSGPLTQQYGRIGEEYRTKRIDVTDRATWLKPEDFA